MQDSNANGDYVFNDMYYTLEYDEADYARFVKLNRQKANSADLESLVRFHSLLQIDQRTYINGKFLWNESNVIINHASFCSTKLIGYSTQIKENKLLHFSLKRNLADQNGHQLIKLVKKYCTKHVRRY